MSTIPVSMIGEVMNCNASEKNHLYVGLCGTKFVGSDRYAVVITEVVSPKCVRVTHMSHEDYDNNIVTDEYGNQYLSEKHMMKYAQLNDERTGFVSLGKLYKFRKNKRWLPEGESLWSTGAVHFGEANNYMDPSF